MCSNASRLLEGRALRSLDPCSVSIRKLERHNTRAPSLRLRLVDTRPERRRVDEPVRRISSSPRLANHELVQLDTIGRDFEHRRARERSARRVQESLAVRVQALVVELDVVLRERSASAQRKQESRQTNAKHAPSQ